MFRIDMSTVFQDQSCLLGIERNLFLCLIYFVIIMIHQPFYRFSAQDRLFKNFLAVF